MTDKGGKTGENDHREKYGLFGMHGHIHCGIENNPGDEIARQDKEDINAQPTCHDEAIGGINRAGDDDASDEQGSGVDRK